jgi:glycine cleavage system H lipoate-binding protein
METLWNILVGAGLFIGGLAFRFAIFFAIMVVLVMALLPFVYASEAVRKVWERYAVGRVAGLFWRAHTYYTPAHAWLRERAGRLRVGLDDLAVRLLGRIDQLTLPLVGEYLKAGDPLMTIGTGPTALLIRAPIEGIVQRVNSELAYTPEALSRDPYRRGWIVEMVPADRGYRNLLRDERAKGWFTNEASRLAVALEHAAGIAAADGGELVIPSELLLTDEAKRALARQFGIAE